MSTESQALQLEQKKELVSVLIRTFNRPITLAKAVDSVLQQTHRPLEIVLVNDGGEPVDSALKTLAEQQQVQFTLLSLPKNQGRSKAANVALKQAQGTALMFLDDDDWLAPNHVAKLLPVLKANPKLIAVYSDTACVLSPTDEKLQKVFDYEFDPLRLAYENYLPIHAVLFNNNALSQACQFNPNLNVYEDWNFWVQLTTQGPMQRVPGITAWYSAQLSGVGFGLVEKDFSAELALFFKHTAPFYTPEQISVMLFMCRNFFSVTQANKHHEAVVTRLQLSLVENNRREEQETAIHSQLNQLTTGFKALATQQEQQQLGFELALKSEAKAVNNQLGQLTQTLQAIQVQQQHQQKVLNENMYALRVFMQQKNGLTSWPIIGKLSQKTATLWHLMQVGDLQGIKIRLVRNIEGVAKKMRLVNTTTVTKVQVNPTQTTSLATRNVPTNLQTDTRPEVSAEPLTDDLALKSNAAGITLLCTSHTLFVAQMLKKHLENFGLTVNSVSDQEPLQYDNSLHIIICAQLFRRLPARYLVFQMEQSVSSRWFNAKYAAILNKAEAVLDYSKMNLAYLQEQQGIPFSKLYYVPISNLPVNNLAVKDSSGKETLLETLASEPVYDVVFYGDVHNPRRKQFLEAISQRFNTLIVSEVFGAELYRQLKQAKVLVNIHYYEGALLETTRIYEALSLGLNIVSEASADQLDHPVLNPWVTFTPIGDLAAMLQAIQTQLDQPRRLVELPDDLAGASFHLGRMLVGLGLLSPLAVQDFAAVFDKQALQQPLCLSMPESYQRHTLFRERHPSIEVFHGLRFSPGWIGCALSYSYLAQQALKQGNDYLEVWEDDVVLDEPALERWQAAKTVFFELEASSSPCDLLSGLLADVSDATQVLDFFEIEGTSYVVIDRMISAVCNFYGKKPLGYMASWDAANQDVHLNTMDRYLEKKDLRVLVPLPFVAGHNPEQDSTLWGCQNSQYDTMIAASEAKLYDKLQRFKLERVTDGSVG